jgi:subtilisin family serine protease
MKSESVWTVLVIAVALLVVASVVVAVAITSNGDDSSALNCKNPKLSTEVADIIPPPGIAPPARSMIVNIYLTENKSEYIEELGNYVIEILYISGTKVVAEIYTSQILAIGDLPFVTYIEKPLLDIPFYELPADKVISFSTGTGKDPKLSTDVADNIPPPGIAPPAELMTVNIYLIETNVEYVDELRNYDIEILYISGTKVVAEIYTDQILEIKNLPFVSYIETPLLDIPFPVIPDENFNTSGGLEILNADTSHNASVTGKGIKVAIIDGAFLRHDDCLKDVTNKSDKSFAKYVDITGGMMWKYEDRVHGTACAEIVHQIAPDAELFLVNYLYIDELAEAVNLIINESVDIITRSQGYPMGLFDGTDEVCTIIDDAVFNHGVIWVNAAGNSAHEHWEGMFNDTDGDSWHEFPYPYPDYELGQAISMVPKGTSLRVWLSWNDSWNNATQDYDLYIFDGSSNALARSIDPQMGYTGHHPYEWLGFEVPARGTYYIVIRNCGATKPVHLELYTDWPLGSNCRVENSSLCADACAFGVIAAGAVDQGNNIEDYSSRGATNDERIKPDFVAPVGYDTCAYSGPFSGTSASSPHIAGEIALLLSWIRETQPEQNGTAYELIKPYLDNIANTIEPDNQYGYGLFPECYNRS